MVQIYEIESMREKGMIEVDGKEVFVVSLHYLVEMTNACRVCATNLLIELGDEVLPSEVYEKLKTLPKAVEIKKVGAIFKVCCFEHENIYFPDFDYDLPSNAIEMEEKDLEGIEKEFCERKQREAYEKIQRENRD